MSRFEGVLSDEEIQDIWNNRLDALSVVTELDLIRMGEHATIAKLRKEGPIAWLHRTDPARAISKWQRDAAIKAGGAIEKKSKEIFSLPAYAVNNPSTSDGPLTDEGTKTLKQHRSEFEVWAKNEGYDLRRNVTRGWPSLFVNYLNPLTQVAYGAWQASKGIRE